MKRLFVVLLALWAAPAAAQDASDDWDLTLRPDQRLAIASLDYGDNLVAVRCQAGSLDVLLTGIADTPRDTRAVRVSIGAIRDEGQIWKAQVGQGVVSPTEPGRIARQLRGGGDLEVRLVSNGGTTTTHRYHLPIPRSAAAVDAVLDACGWPRVDPRDDAPRLTPGSMLWDHQVSPEYPDRAQALGIREGRVELNCIVSPELRLVDCLAEREDPVGADFAASAALAAGRSRVRADSPDTLIVGAVARFTIVFRLDD